jgi:hypothetical protein
MPLLHEHLKAAQGRFIYAVYFSNKQKGTGSTGEKRLTSGQLIFKTWSVKNASYTLASVFKKKWAISNNCVKFPTIDLQAVTCSSAVSKKS